MTERVELVQKCKRELERLKKEEALIRELLRDVQKQLGKYKVEALHMSHVNLTGDDMRDQKLEDVELTSDNLISAETIDIAEIINKNELNLELGNESLREEFEEEDEDESDESEFFD